MLVICYDDVCECFVDVVYDVNMNGLGEVVFVLVDVSYDLLFMLVCLMDVV